MRDRLTRRNILVLAVGSLILVSSITLAFLYNQDEPIDIEPGFNNVIVNDTSYTGSLDAEINFIQTEFYKGDNIPFQLKVKISNNPARLISLLIGVIDHDLSRTANQSIVLDILLQPGEHTLDLELNPGFDQNGFVALTDKNYTLTDYTLIYDQIQKRNHFTGSLNHGLSGYLSEIHDQSPDLSWNVVNEINATINIDGNRLNVTSSQQNATVEIVTEIQTTAYTRVMFEADGLENSSIDFEITNRVSFKNVSSGYYPIGQYNGFQNLTILFNITSNEDINVTLKIPTQKIAILTVVANNNWDKTSEDGTTFRAPNYYLNQLNIHFSNVFNLTFVEVANVEFSFDSLSSNLFSMRQQAELQLGEKLELPDARWQTGVGTQLRNAGGDILLILSNRTMDHLGVVFRNATGDQNLNLAIATGGSKNTGQESIELRLPSNFADNLIQHELSHIFRAPDRWTESDPPSVMTKSRPADALVDIATSQYWLMRTDWLEEDIQTMVDHFDIFLKPN